MPDVPGYEILAELGRGNMGVVYKARHLSTGRVVALKTILGGSHTSREALERFSTEAQVVATLRHPNVVQTFDVDLSHDCPYFTMELVEGGNLAERIFGWPQPVRASVELVVTLARTTHAAHLAGVVHRDLKPSNVLLVPVEKRDAAVERLSAELNLAPSEPTFGTPKITDFGLAKRLGVGVEQTQSGMILGTPGYMAPEQAEGRSRDVGPAADVYSLGAILYECLTGRPPFAAESPMEAFMLLLQAEPLAPSRLRPKLPRDLETICLKCLEKQPHRRYKSAGELADDLTRFLAGEPIRARPAPLREVAWKWAKRRPVRSTLLACSLLAFLCLLGGLLWHQAELRGRLGQALADERDARAAQEGADERERVEQLRGRVKELLGAGEAAVAARDWREAEAKFTSARDQAVGDDLADLRERAELLLLGARRQRADRERLEKFRRRRNDALFCATLHAGGDQGAAPRDTREAALEALALFGVSPENLAGPDVGSQHYSPSQKAEVVAGCYELLLVLAEAQPLAEDALRLLDRAAHLGVTTQAYHHRRAGYLCRLGRNDAAEEQTQLAARIRPATALDHFLLGEQRQRQGDGRTAIGHFEDALQVEPQHFWASYYLALCYLATNRAEQAAARLTACLGQRRDFPWLFLLRASAWCELHQAARAEEDFDSALRLPLTDSALYGLLVNRSVLRIRQKRFDGARADLERAIALRPGLHQAYANLALAEFEAGRLDESIRQLAVAIRCAPTSAALFRTRARVHVRRGASAAALADLDRAIRLAGDAASQQTAEDHLERGRILRRQKDDARALAACDESLRLRPRHGAALRLRAEVLIELKRLPEALLALDDCVKFGPADVDVFRARAALRTRMGDYGGAQADYARAIETKADAPTHVARGWCLLVANAPRLALADFEEAIRLDPKCGDAYAGRGYVRAVSGDVRRAVADAEEALRHGPASSRLYYNVARVYAQAADADSRKQARSTDRADWQQRATRALTKSLELHPPGEARQFWQTVVRSDKALAPLRGDAAYRQLAARYESRRDETEER